VVIDEAAFAKNGDNKVDGSMMEIWEKAIKPTLFDYGGEVLICSNSAGKNPDNFFYNISTDPSYGFGEFHATTMDNPTLPKPDPEESKAVWSERRKQFIAELIRGNDPLVYQQEYLAEFVDWAGVAFFAREKLLENGQPVPSSANTSPINFNRLVRSSGQLRFSRQDENAISPITRPPIRSGIARCETSFVRRQNSASAAASGGRSLPEFDITKICPTRNLPKNHESCSGSCPTGVGSTPSIAVDDTTTREPSS
jgi:hypothetical protein